MKDHDSRLPPQSCDLAMNCHQGSRVIIRPWAGGRPGQAQTGQLVFRPARLRPPPPPPPLPFKLFKPRPVLLRVHLSITSQRCTVKLCGPEPTILCARDVECAIVRYLITTRSRYERSCKCTPKKNSPEKDSPVHRRLLELLPPSPGPSGPSLPSDSDTGSESSSDSDAGV